MPEDAWAEDMVAKKADHSVLRLLQISQQHIESQLERVKHERELLCCKSNRTTGDCRLGSFRLCLTTIPQIHNGFRSGFQSHF